LAIGNVDAAPDPVGYGQCGSQSGTVLTVQAQVVGAPSYVTLQYHYVSVNAKVPPGPYRKVSMGLLKGDTYSASVDVGTEADGDLQGTTGVVDFQVLVGNEAGDTASSLSQKVQVQSCLG
jgi:hypothetical protein